jgi:hypothetical protein
MPEELKLVSPARQLAQQVVVRGLPEAAGVEDVVNAVKYAGPRPTIYNVNTGEWDEVTPAQARLMGAPLGPPTPEIINRMWRNGPVHESPWQGEQLT